MLRSEAAERAESVEESRGVLDLPEAVDDEVKRSGGTDLGERLVGMREETVEGIAGRRDRGVDIGEDRTMAWKDAFGVQPAEGFHRGAEMGDGIEGAVVEADVEGCCTERLDEGVATDRKSVV